MFAKLCYFSPRFSRNAVEIAGNSKVLPEILRAREPRLDGRVRSLSAAADGGGRRAAPPRRELRHERVEPHTWPERAGTAAAAARRSELKRFAKLPWEATDAGQSQATCWKIAEASQLRSFAETQRESHGTFAASVGGGLLRASSARSRARSRRESAVDLGTLGPLPRSVLKYGGVATPPKGGELSHSHVHRV